MRDGYSGDVCIWAACGWGVFGAAVGKLGGRRGGACGFGFGDSGSCASAVG